MKVRVPVLCAATALLLARPIAAQRPGSVEVGGFLRYTDFDNSLLVSNKVGFGARIGVGLPARFSVEGDFSSVSTDRPGAGSVKHTPYHLLLLYNVPASAKSEVIVGAGYVHNKYGFGSADTTDSGIAATVGVRVRVQQMVAARIDVGEDFIPSPANQGPGQSFNGNLAIQVGVSFLLNWKR
jgi:outer membrane protein with beta-barrel domain